MDVKTLSSAWMSMGMHSWLACTWLTEWTGTYLEWAINLTAACLLNSNMSVMGSRRNEANYGSLPNTGSSSVATMSAAAKSAKKKLHWICVKLSCRQGISQRWSPENIRFTLPVMQLRPLQPTKQPWLFIAPEYNAFRRWASSEHDWSGHFAP